MTTVSDIQKALEALAPAELKMDWDNVGLLCGCPEKEVRKILVALDPFEHVCREAAELGADLLLTHHPLLFRPASQITTETAVGRSILILARNNIAALNAHTNLDCADGGVNDVLAAALGLENITAVMPARLLRQGTVSPTALPDFLYHVQEALGTPGLRYADGGRPVHRVAVGGGACAGELADAANAGCDTFVTADVRYNQFWDAKDLGISLIDAGHFYTENPVCNKIAAYMAEKFPEIQVVCSKTHEDAAKFFISY